jgi:hypothetical protein
MIYMAMKQITITKLFIVTNWKHSEIPKNEYKVSTTKEFRITPTHLTPYRFILIIHYQFQISLRSSYQRELHLKVLNNDKEVVHTKIHSI